MNQILIKQDTEVQIERLAAQRHVYSFAKKLYFLQFLGSIIIPVILSGVALFVPAVSPYAALYTVIFFIADSIIFEQQIKALRAKAAKIQELFDCEILQIIKSPFKSPDDVLLEEIHKYSDKHQKKEENRKELLGWYAQSCQEISSLPIFVARLICQRENLSWDAELRKLFGQSLLILSVLLIIVLILIGWFGGFEFSRVVLLFNGLLPLFRFSVKQYIDNKETNEKYNKVLSIFQKTWEKILNSQIDEQELTIISRQIQNEIYDSRTKNPLIPDFFYWLYKKAQQKRSRVSVQRLIDEVKQSNSRLLKP